VAYLTDVELIAAAEGRGPPVLSIALESMVMVLDCPYLALEAQLIQNLLNKPRTKFGTVGACPWAWYRPRSVASRRWKAAYCPGLSDKFYTEVVLFDVYFLFLNMCVYIYIYIYLFTEDLFIIRLIPFINAIFGAKWFK